MSKEKQSGDCKNCNSHVEEMAKDLCKARMCRLDDWEGCPDKDGGCIRCRRVAEIMTVQNYCKQSEGEWVACPDEHEICATEFACSNCKESFCSSELTDEEFLKMMKFCPNCGAKMKGGAE